MRGFVESSCAVHIAARRHGYGGVQHHVLKPAYTVAPYFHHSLGTIRIGRYNDPSFGGDVSTKYRCHSPCHLEMSLLGGWGRAVGGRGAPA